MANLKEALEAGLSALDGLYSEQADAPLSENRGQWRLAMNEAGAALRLMKSALKSYNSNEISNPEIVLAYLEGKEIQYQDNYSKEWKSYHFDGVRHPKIGHSSYHWRVRPDVNKVVKYRRYLVKYVDDCGVLSGYNMLTLTNKDDISPILIEQMFSFVRWIDTEWQEVEV